MNSDRLTNILDVLPFGVAVIRLSSDPASVALLYANPAFRKLFSLKPTDTHLPPELLTFLSQYPSAPSTKPHILTLPNHQNLPVAFVPIPLNPQEQMVTLVEYPLYATPGDPSWNQFVLDLQELTRIVYWERDPHTLAFHYISPTATMILNLSPDEIYLNPHRLDNLIHPDDCDAYHRFYQSLATTDENQKITYRFKCPSGEIRYLTDFVFPIIHDGEMTRLRGLTLDVTRLYITKHQLDETRTRYQLLTEFVSDYAAEYEITEENEIKLVWLTPSYSKVTGYTSEEIQTREQRRRIVHPDDIPWLTERTKQTLEKGIPKIAEYRIIRKDGEIRWVRDYVRPIVDPKTGKVTRLLQYGQDITERKQTELALQESEKRLRTLVEALDAAVILIHPDGSVLQWNRRARQMLHEAHLIENPDPPNGQNIYEIFRSHPVWYPLYQILRKISPTTPHTSTEIQIQKNPEKVIHWTVKIMPALKESSPGYILLLGTDISESVHLRQQIHTAERIETITRLAGGIAHTFNNLLMVIQGNLELIRLEARNQPTVYRHLMAAYSAAQQVAEMTRKLLGFARRRFGEPEIVNINAAIVRLRSRLLEWVHPAEVHLKLQLDSHDPHILIDPTQLDEIVTQLVRNAAQVLNRNGTIQIRTGFRTVDESLRTDHPFIPFGKYVTLEIEDDGPGIPKDLLPHIFEPFFSTRDRRFATRLGLATVYGLVKQNDGYIIVNSQVGEGTTFTIFFPPASIEQPQMMTPKPTMKTLHPTILVIEDDTLVRDVITRGLQINQFRVLSAMTGQEAERIFADFKDEIALVLIDVFLGDIPGPQLIRHFRDQVPDLPVVYITGYAENDLLRIGLNPSSDIILYKPFTLEDLNSTVKFALKINHNSLQP